MKFPSAPIRVTHTGYAVSTSQSAASSCGGVVVRQFDRTELATASLGLTFGDRRSFRSLVKLADQDLGQAYVAYASDNNTDSVSLPILAVVRIAGGPKTSDRVRSTLGRSVPFVGEREHLLAGLWVSSVAEPAVLSAAFGAMAFVAPPANLARTIIILPESARRGSTATQPITTSLATAGFSPYIHCVSQFNWKRPWRRKVDWIGPPPPARSVVTTTAADNGQRPAALIPTAINHLTQEVSQ